MQPLAADLGLEVDISCDRDDPKCVEDVVKDYDGEGNILICWQHDALTDIVDELGVDDAPEYDSDMYVPLFFPYPIPPLGKRCREDPDPSPASTSSGPCLPPTRR